jgi:hypothetical protein
VDTGTGDALRSRRAWPHRAGLLAIIACIALPTAAACGSGSVPTGAGGSATAVGTPAASQQLVAFAQCMRAHGIPNYPDPSAVSGPIDSSQLGVSDSTYESAKTTCVQLDPPPQRSAGLTTAQEQQVLGKLLVFSRCMRSHGMPSFPDPNPASTIWGPSGKLFNLPASFNPNSPQFTSAANACKSLMPSSGEIRGNKSGA